MLIDHIIRKICNSRIEEVIFISDNFTLLDYGYWFMQSLYVVDSRAKTRTLSYYYLHKILECS